MRPARSLLVLLALAAPGCRPAAVPPPAASAGAPLAEPAWSTQVADVRAGRSRQIVVANPAVSDIRLADLADGCQQLEVLDLESVEVSPEALGVLDQLPNLKRIRLGGPIDDRALAALAAVDSLTTLNLPSATFSDKGLEQLAMLPQLELLRFHSPNVTDDGLRHIAAMPALRFLHLIDVPVTDAGIAHLHSMSRLESFYLDGDQCTDGGLRDLLAALPELHFHRDQLHLPDDPLADDHAPTRPGQSRRAK